MRTTARISLCALALLAAGIAGCRDDDRLSYEKDAQEGDVPPIGVQSISVLKSLYHDRTIRITQEISIQGHIVANDTAGEFYKEIVVEDDTGGIVLSIDDEPAACSTSSRSTVRDWRSAARAARCCWERSPRATIASTASPRPTWRATSP